MVLRVKPLSAAFFTIIMMWGLIAFDHWLSIEQHKHQLWFWIATAFIAVLFGYLVFLWLKQPVLLERKIAETTEALRESQERYALAVRGAREGLWDWNIVAGQIYYSDRYKELLGIKGDERGGVFETWERIVHPEDRYRILRALKLHLDRQIPYNVEFRIRRDDDSERWIRSSGQAVWDASGKATRMAGSIRDITDRKLAEVELKQARDLLEERVNQRTQELQRANEELAAALARVRVLSGLIPICASCKRIRDDRGYWNQLEVYIQTHSDAEFSHGICPQCAEKYYGEIYKLSSGTLQK